MGYNVTLKDVCTSVLLAENYIPFRRLFLPNEFCLDTDNSPLVFHSPADFLTFVAPPPQLKCT